MAAAQWQVKEEKDSMTDAVRRTASVFNSEGHSLTVYRLPNDSVWMNFSLAERTTDQIASDKAPLFRVDKNSPHDLESEKRAQEMKLKMDFYSWKPKFINFVIWHGKETDGRSTTLNELMTGATVLFRYYLPTGGYKETSFSLTQAGSAIATALGISQEVDLAKEARIQAMKSEVVAALKACVADRKNFPACNQKLTSCRGEAKDDADLFRACFAK
jgi:hypothetical protein